MIDKKELEEIGKELIKKYKIKKGIKSEEYTFGFNGGLNVMAKAYQIALLDYQEGRK